MVAALIGAIAYVYWRNHLDGFAPDKNKADSVVANLSVFLFFGVAAFSLGLCITANDASAEDPEYVAIQMDDGEIYYLWTLDSPSVAPMDTSDTVVDILSSSSVTLAVPTSRWTQGCSATSAGMIFGYYDQPAQGYTNMYAGPQNGGVAPMTELGQGKPGDTGFPFTGSCHLIATSAGFDGRSASNKGHTEDYWISFGSQGPDPWDGNWTEHTWGQCTADYMGTNQWKWDYLDTDNPDGIDFNTDGSTALWTYSSNAKLYDKIPPAGNGLPQTSLCHGMKLFAESRGYSVVTNYTQRTDNQITGGFSYADFKAEIDAGRPVMIQVTDHSMVGVGYDDTSSDLVYFHDTWDNSLHSATWVTTAGANFYAGMNLNAITVIQLTEIDPPNVTSVTPTDGSTLTYPTQDFDVAFSEPVVNVSTGDMILSGTAASQGAYVDSVTDIGGSHYLFTLKQIYDGTLNINLSGNIEDGAGNSMSPYSGSYTVDLSYDFGDAPSPYPTLLANNGARHIIEDTFIVFLNGSIDWPETDGQPDPNALGDDNNNIDDEDGIVFTSPLEAGSTVSVTVYAGSLSATTSGLLNAWFDFNDDGDWNDAGEQIFIDTPITASSTPPFGTANYLTFTIPWTATITSQTFARFRLNQAGGLTPTGFAWDGEVEDYEVEIEKANLVYNGYSGDDYFMIVLNGTNNLEITHITPFNGSSGTYPLDKIATLTFNGLGGDDTMEVDYSGGVCLPDGGLTFNGGTETSSDELKITGGSCTGATYNHTNLNDGTIDLDTKLITYTGLEPISATITATNVTLNYSTVAETITISSGGVGQTTVNSTAGEFVTFNNPTGSLTINAGNIGGDTIDVNGVGSGFTADLIINGQDGNDSITINALPDNVPTNIDGGGGTDSMTVHAVQGILSPLVYEPTSEGAGTVVDFFSYRNDIDLIGMESLHFTGQLADLDLLGIDGTIGNDQLEYVPGLTSDAGTILTTYDMNNATGNGPFTLPLLTFDGMEQASILIFNDFNQVGGTDTFIFNGTGGDDVITATGGGAGFTTITNYVLASLFSNLQVENSVKVYVNGLGGGDTITMDGLGEGIDLTINAGSGDDTLKAEGSATTGSIVINGNDGDDTLTVDFGSGNPIPEGGLFYNGDGHTSGDSLTLQGGTFDSETYTVTGANSGTIDLDSSLITFTGLEPIYDTVTVVQLDILLTSAGEAIYIEDGSGIGSFTTTEVSGTTFESMIFANKTTVTVNGFDGADYFTLNNPNGADGLVNLKLYGNELTDGGLNIDDGFDDIFSLIASSASVTLISMYGQSGDDFFRHIFNPEGGNLTNLLCDMALYGGAGSDDVALQNPNSNIATAATLTSTQLIGAAPGTITYGEVESFFYESSSAGDTIDILSTNASTTYTISGDGGSDSITIGNQTSDFGTVFDGSLDTILGPITIVPDFNPLVGNNDILNIDDSGTASLDSSPASITNMGTVSHMVVPIILATFDGDITRLSGFSPATIDYFHGDITNFLVANRLENLNIICSTGADTVNVNDTTTTVQTSVDLFTGDDSSTMTITGDNLSAGNVFMGNTGNDKFVLNINIDLGASAVFPITTLQIEGNAPASDPANRDILEIVDYSPVVRTLTYTYLTPVGGDIDITGLAIPMNIRTMETIIHNGDPGDDDILTVVGSTNIDNFFATALASDFAILYVNGGVGSSAGPDLILDGLHETNGLTIDGDDPPFFTEPEDYLQYDGSGVLTFSGPGEGKIDGSGVLNVNFQDIEILDATGVFTVLITADSLAPGTAGDTNPDTFMVYRSPTGVGTYHRLEINGTLIYNIVFTAVDNLTINGGLDDDTLTCDFTNGNPIPLNGIFFNGGATTDDVIYLQGGTVLDIIYTFFNATDGTIEIDGLLITYTGLNPIYDNLGASNRTFDFPATPDIIRIYRLSMTVTRIESDDSSELVEFLSPTASMTVNMRAGDDILTIGDDDPDLVPGFADDFTAALTINGNKGMNTINVRGPVGTPLGDTNQKLASIAFNVQLANLYQPMYSDDITGTCVIVNVWFPGLIQNALDIAHLSYGCLITVYPGTYPENLTNSKPNITLRSASGAAVTTISASSGYILDLMIGTVGFTLGGDHDIGFTLLSTGSVERGVTGIDLVNLTITHNSFVGPVMDYGIHLKGVTTASPPSLIMMNTFYNCGTAIAVYNGSGTSRLTITRNCIFNSTAHGILIGEDGTGDLTTVVITENTLSNETIGLKVENGPHIKTDFLVVKYNNFMGNHVIGLQNDTSILLNAEKNWWGAAGGPDATNNPNGIPSSGDGGGDPIEDYVIAESWLVVIYQPNPCDLMISLDEGWNLVSINVALDSLGGDYTASKFAAEMNSQAGEDIVKYIVAWDENAGRFLEFVVSTGIGTDFPIEYGRAYYIHSDSTFPLIFYVVGDCPIYETVDLKECWNLIGWLSRDTLNVGDFADIINHTANWPTTQAIVKYNDAYDQGENEYIAWYPGMDDDEFQLVPGEAYWVFVAYDVSEVPYP